MFQSARLKLTLWYIILIAVISIFFSLAIYKASTREFERFKHLQQTRIEQSLRLGVPLPLDMMRRNEQGELAITSIDEAEQHLALTLIFVNIGILLFTALAGYLLAGRTLRPIQIMIDEQNRFITDASHELRTPLTALKSEIEVNLRDKKLTPGQARQLLTSNLEEVNNLQSLTDHLMLLTQNQHQDDSLFANVSLAEVINEAVKKVSSLAKPKHVTVTTTGLTGLVFGDRQSLVELLVILLDNAIKYGPIENVITVTAHKTDHHVSILVTDKGDGIDPTDLPHIFDRFYRADKSRTKDDASGYGLGLSIAQQIVKRHHGSIKVQSGVGKGTTFTISLPAAR